MEFTPFGVPLWFSVGHPHGMPIWKGPCAIPFGFPIEDDYGAFAGAGGQYTVIIPARGLVIARLGKYTGSGPGGRNLNAAISLLMEAVPQIED